MRSVPRVGVPDFGIFKVLRVYVVLNILFFMNHQIVILTMILTMILAMILTVLAAP